MHKTISMLVVLLIVFISNAYSSNIEPVTKWHYATNGNVSGGMFLPAAYGFNVADVSDVDTLNSLPPGIMGMVYIGYSFGGVDSTFQSKIAPFIGNPRVLGFYLADEPDITGTWGTYYSPANLRAQSDYIHAKCPNVNTFIVLANQGGQGNPVFIAKDKSTGRPNSYTYKNTHIDLFGIAAYPIQSQFSVELASNGNHFISNFISAYVQAAIASGIVKSSIIPIYQAFGNYPGGSWSVPTAMQEKEILRAWAAQTLTPYFDYAYSWGGQKGDTALANAPSLRGVFFYHNTKSTTGGNP